MNFIENTSNSGGVAGGHETVNDHGHSSFGFTARYRVSEQPKRILICRPNHRLGNLLLITPLLQEVSQTFPNCRIDLFVKGNLAPILFKNYENINTIIQLPKRPFLHLLKYIYSWMQIRRNHYDLVINVDSSSLSGRISARFASSKLKILGTAVEDFKSKFIDYEHHAKFAIYNLRGQLKKNGLYQKYKPIASLNLKLDPFEISEGKRILSGLVQNDNTTIGLFTYATGKKCYSGLWWQKFYQRLKIEYPYLNIIEILPIQNISQLSGQVPTFYSKDIRMIGSVIANTALFIGADSGIMHLASSTGIPTVGLFSVTDLTRYAPYNNHSIAINTNSSNTAELIRVISSILNLR